ASWAALGGHWRGMGPWRHAPYGSRSTAPRQPAAKARIDGKLAAAGRPGHARRVQDGPICTPLPLASNPGWQRRPRMARILLADDDAAARALVQRALAVDGHSVTCTQDGAEALEQLQGAAPAFDLLIADVLMPALDGIAVAETAMAQQPGLRVILISGF